MRFQSRPQIDGQTAPRGALAIPGAAGELIDKITILEIKESYIKEAAKLDNIRLELTLLRQLKTKSGYGGERLAKLEANSRLPIVCSGTSKILFENMNQEAIRRWHRLAGTPSIQHQRPEGRS
jgi:hypothetical protein